MMYIELLLVFLRIGAFTFGGGLAMLAFVQQEVINHSWLGKEELIDFIAISESTPGPLAVNVSTFVGFKTLGIGGAFCATFGVVFPSFVIILLVAKVYDRFQSNRFVKGAMDGIKAAVVGMIGAMVISTAVSVYGVFVEAKDIAEIIAATILLGGVLFGLKKKINPIILIVLSAGAGIIVKSFI